MPTREDASAVFCRHAKHLLLEFRQGQHVKRTPAKCNTLLGSAYFSTETAVASWRCPSRSPHIRPTGSSTDAAPHHTPSRLTLFLIRKETTRGVCSEMCHLERPLKHCSALRGESSLDGGEDVDEAGDECATETARPVMCQLLTQTRVSSSPRCTYRRALCIFSPAS